jgi:hypothetical protein
MLKKLLFFLRPGFLKGLIFRARLILSLLRDRRVSFVLKLIPIAALAYLVVPNPFPFDDLLVLGLGMTLFIELSPKPVVKDLSDRLSGVATVA